MSIPTRPQVLWLTLAALLVLPTAALAQAIDVPAAVTLDMPEKTWSHASFTHQFKSDLDDAGDMSRSGVMLGLGHRFDISDDWYFAAQGTYIGSYYDFSNAAGSVGNAGAYRWHDIHTFSLFGLFGYKANEQWTWVGGAVFRLSGESGSNTDDSVTGGALVGFDYKSSDTLKLGLLLGAMSQIEDSGALLPIPTVKWDFADDWTFNFGLLTSLGHPGIGPEFTYKASEHLNYAVGLAYQKRRFRLDNHPNNAARGPNPNNNGVGQETSVPLYARMRWAPSQTAFVDLFAGVTVGGDIRVERRHGGKIKETGYDPAGILGLRGNILF